MNNEELLKHLENIENNLTILVKLNIAQVINQVITDENEKILYEFTGIKKRADILEDLHISPNTVSDLWNLWYNLGILKKEGNSFKKVIE